MRVDYRSFLDKIWEALPAAEYVAMASDPHVLGNPLLKTQHFIGSSKWEYVSDTEVIGWHQLRVPHQRYTDDSRKEVAVKGHAHGSNQHWYKKIDGVWKFAGLAPIIRWGEFDFDSVFASGRETFGDKEKDEEQIAVAAGISVDIGQPDADIRLGSTPYETQREQEAAQSAPTEPAPIANPIVETPMGNLAQHSDLSPVNPLSLQNGQIEEVTPIIVEHNREPITDADSQQDHVELVRMAKEDGKLFEMQVEQVPAEDVLVTL